TKIAQVLLRDYSESIRSVVMDSPLPLESNYDEVSVTNLYEAIGKLLDDCESSPDCANRFPELRNRFFDFLISTNQKPLELSVTHPNDSTEVIVKLKGKDLITVFSDASTSDIPKVPLEIDKLLNGDYTLIEARLAALFQAPDKGDGKGMRLSVWCAEEFPFADKKVVAEQKNRYPELRGLSAAVFSKEVCNIWNVKRVDDIENKPVSSDVPVLLISGEYDENTPPYFAEMLSDNFTNSFHLMFKGWKHGPITNWGNPCAMSCANAFFNNPLKRPNLECFEQIKQPVFITESLQDKMPNE
ncbi:MAG: alpha/beta hydrolase, partial [Bacteroidota bacterium]